MATPQPTERLTESYARWRSSRLGQITDTLEQQLLFELLGSVADKTLLDVGCGDGALASELARRGAIVTGLDADPAMIAAARRNTEIEATQLRLIEGQAERLPFDDELYVGRLVWNRLTYLKDPQSGRRRSRHNSPEKWIVQEVPALRIVDDELWNAVKARQGSIRASDNIANARATRFWSAGVLATC